MTRWLVLPALLLAACSPQYAIVDDDGLGSLDSGDEWVDDGSYDGATLRIVHPQSGDFLPIEEENEFVASLVNAEGEPLDFEEVHWSSSADDAWDRTGLDFIDGELSVGVHDLTAEVQLPNGDRLAHTVGGVLVQSYYTGTYAGTFSANVQTDQFPIACAGGAVLRVDPLGELVTGDATCLVSVFGFEAEIQFLFELDNDDGDVEGVAAADIMGFFQFDLPAEGKLSRDGELELTFAGDGGGFATVDGAVTAERISLDSQD